MNEYKLGKIPTCKPIVISQHTETRPLVKTDINTLEQTFTQLGFADPDMSIQDHDRDQILAELLKISVNEEYTHSKDFFLCVIISEGINGCFHDVKGHDISIDEVVHIFNTENCIGLRNKPKIFIVQTDDYTIDVKTLGAFSDGKGSMVRIPTQADVLIYHCSIPRLIEKFEWDVESIKNKWKEETGSIFIHTFCDILKRNPDTEIHQLTINVNKALKIYIDDINSRKLKKRGNELSKLLQLPVCTSQLRNCFRFKQKRLETDIY